MGSIPGRVDSQSCMSQNMANKQANEQKLENWWDQGNPQYTEERRGEGGKGGREGKAWSLKKLPVRDQEDVMEPAKRPGGRSWWGGTARGCGEGSVPRRGDHMHHVLQRVRWEEYGMGHGLTTPRLSVILTRAVWVEWWGPNPSVDLSRDSKNGTEDEYRLLSGRISPWKRAESRIAGEESSLLECEQEK